MTTRLPALGLEGTAARIEAACAARESQVDPWEASLPKPVDFGMWMWDRAASALSNIAGAMAHVNAGQQSWGLVGVRAAAAEVREWRLSLPEDQQSVPFALPPGRRSVRVTLRQAVRDIVAADMSPGLLSRGHYLRGAEAYLRAAGEALIAQGAE